MFIVVIFDQTPAPFKVNIPELLKTHLIKGNTQK